MSTPFLQDIAQHFARTHAADLYRYRFFFPNRRAGLFFQHHLRRAVGDRATLLPELTTMGEYLRHVLHLPDEDVNNDLFVTYELYRAFSTLMDNEIPRSFNDFYYLGGLILSDFNDIDKHLLPVEKVFRNVADYQELEGDLSFLDEKQREALRSFFGNKGFLDKTKEYQQKFIEFWEKLPDLYRDTKANLAERGLHYEGMLLRHVVERLEEGDLCLVEDGRIPVFVGLNALTPCEKKILKHFKEVEKGTLFYWDYVSELLSSSHLAGAFRRNQDTFPMPTEGTEDYIAFDTTPQADEQTIDLVALPSEVAQAAYIGELLNRGELNEEIQQLKTAVVLPSERLLIPLLSHIPSQIPSLNVTMGYPIRELPDVGMLLRLIELRALFSRRNRRWRGEEIREILSMNPLYDVLGENDFAQRCVQKLVDEHWFFLKTTDFMERIVAQLSATERQLELTRLLFRDFDSGADLLQWIQDIVHFRRQSLSYREDEEGNKVCSGVSSVLPYLAELLEQQSLSIHHYTAEHPHDDDSPFSYNVVQDLLVTLLRQSRIPYSGEPLKGLQVMGILETRGLDFDTIIIPDAAEGILPSKTRLTGVIPYPIREGLGLPTYKWQEQTRAYNFFRLISRAKRIITTFDTRRGDHSGGEPSRYISLLEHIYDRKVNKINANYPLRFDSNARGTFQLEKDKVNAFVDGITIGKKNLSASRLNRFQQCPRLFYYTCILGIEEREEMEELISERDMGTLVHNTLQQLYAKYEGKTLDKTEIRGWLEEGDSTLSDELTKQYNSLFKQEGAPITGMNAITFDRAKSLVRNVLKLDSEYPTDIHYIGGEVKFEYKYPYNPGSDTVNLKGYIDRLDYVVEDGKFVLRVIDYKTGRDKLEFKMKTITEGKDNFNTAALQLFFYSYFLSDPSLARSVIDQRYTLPSSYHIRPLIIKPKIANDGRLSFEKGESLDDFNVVREEYKEILDKQLSTLTNRDTEFDTTPRRYVCDYCPAKAICPSAII